MVPIACYADYLHNLMEIGFGLSGDNGEDVFSFAPYYTNAIHWHTGDEETDPWEWRMRLLHEYQDIAYGKLFFNKSGMITKEWYPYFLAVRRGADGFEDAYYAGNISNLGKRIYEVIEKNGPMQPHQIKAAANLSKEERAKFGRTITQLQMQLFITTNGYQRKRSNMGLEYGWETSVFCTPEQQFGERFVLQAAEISAEEAQDVIAEQIYTFNPQANEKKVRQFILGK